MEACEWVDFRIDSLQCYTHLRNKCTWCSSRILLCIFYPCHHRKHCLDAVHELGDNSAHNWICFCDDDISLRSTSLQLCRLTQAAIPHSKTWLLDHSAACKQWHCSLCNMGNNNCLSTLRIYFHGVDRELAVTVALGVIALAMIIWFILENTLWKQHLLYTVTIYPVLIWAFTASVIMNLNHVSHTNTVIMQALLTMSGTFFIGKICHLTWNVVQKRKHTRSSDDIEMSQIPRAQTKKDKQKYTPKREGHQGFGQWRRPLFTVQSVLKFRRSKLYKKFPLKSISLPCQYLVLKIVSCVKAQTRSNVTPISIYGRFVKFQRKKIIPI